MIATLLLVTAAADVSLSAKMPRGKLKPGNEYEIEIEVDLGGEINPYYMWDEGFEAKGWRRPLLLLDVPDCIELVGSVPDPLQTPADFQQDFLRYPYGRRLMEKREVIRIRLISEPEPDDRIGLNLVAYPGTIGVDSEKDSGFVRLRAELILRSGKKAKARPSDDSSWGPDGLIHIGDEAPDFDLPREGGQRLTLSSFRGKQKVLLIVYRRET